MSKRRKKRSLGSTKADDLWSKYLKKTGGACKGVRWRCPTKGDCYATSGKQTLLRVECYPDGGCLSEAVFVKQRPYARRRMFADMDAAKEWACETGKKGY